MKLREGKDKNVGVVFRTENGRLVHGGEVKAKQGCWSLLKGGIVPDVSGFVYILFQVQHHTCVFIEFGYIHIFCVDEIFMRKQSEDREAMISANNVSLKQFSKEEWKLKQDQLIEKVAPSGFWSIISNIHVLKSIVCCFFCSYMTHDNCR